MYRTDGQLLNINRFRAKRQTTTISIMELQYADDNALVALSEEDLQCILSAFAKAYKQLGLAINIKKTQVLHQPPPNSDMLVLPPNISIDNIRLENVDHFPYLGSLLSSKAIIDDEIHHRLSCASVAFSRLRKRVFENRDLQAKTKILVYKAVVLPTLLYGSEAWTTYSRHLKASEKSSGLAGRTDAPTPASWRRLTSPPSLPPSPKTSSDGLAMLSECLTLASQNKSCSPSSLKGNGPQEVRRKGTRTP